MSSDFVTQMIQYIQDDKISLIIVSGKDHQYIRSELHETAKQLNHGICFWKRGSRFEDPVFYGSKKEFVIPTDKFLSSTYCPTDVEKFIDTVHTFSLESDDEDDIFDECFTTRDQHHTSTHAVSRNIDTADTRIKDGAVTSLLENSDADDVVRWFDQNFRSNDFIVVVEDKGEAFSFCSKILDSISSKPSTGNKILVLLIPMHDEEVPEVGDYGRTISGPLPGKVALYSQYIKIMGEHKLNLPSEGVQRTVINTLQGCTLLEADILLKKFIRRYGTLENVGISEFQEERYSYLKKETDALTFIPITGNVPHVGYHGLRNWIRIRRDLTSDDAQDYGIHSPRGILLVGPPGTGKTLGAKMISQELNRPLFSFNLDTLFQRLVGVGEEKTRRTLELIDSLGEITVFIDEIEKLIGGTELAGNAHETTQRLVGMLLTWLSNRESHAFVVATSNNLLRLPAEFSRRGRWDQVFYLDLPSLKERKEILSLHLDGRKHILTEDDVTEIASITTGYSGAELAGLVQDSLISAYMDEKRPLCSDDLKKAVSVSPPLAMRRPVELQIYRKMAKHIAIPASLEDSDFAVGVGDVNENTISTNEWDGRAYQ